MGLYLFFLVWYVQYYVESIKSGLFFLFLVLVDLTLHTTIFRRPKKRKGNYSKWKGWKWLNFFVLDFKKFVVIASVFLISISLLLFVKLPFWLFVFNCFLFSCLGWYIGMCWTLDVFFRKIMNYKVRIGIDILFIIIGLMFLISLCF